MKRVLFKAVLSIIFTIGIAYFFISVKNSPFNEPLYCGSASPLAVFDQSARYNPDQLKKPYSSVFANEQTCSKKRAQHLLVRDASTTLVILVVVYILLSLIFRIFYQTKTLYKKNSSQ